MGSGDVFVPQVEADEKEIADLLFADMPLTFAVVSAVVVVVAESMRTDCVLDRGVDAWESESSFVCDCFSTSDRFFTCSLPLALFVFIAESMCIGRSGMSSWGRG